MRLKTRLLSTSLFCCVSSALALTPAHAQTAADEPSTADIIVTAQKRAQSIESVGMAITALSNDQLRAQGIRGVSDLPRVEPSLNLQNSTFGQVTYTVRGVGYNDFSLAATPTVSIYEDEAPFAFPNMSKGATFDLDRVEVLKGPQGTLFGQNATAGAVNFIAAKPTDKLSAGIEATYARFNSVNLNGYVSGPITDTLRARLAFDYNRGGAWQRSVTRDDSLGDKDSKFVRLLLDWRPTEKLKIAVNLNAWSDNSDTTAPQKQAAYVGTPSAAPLSRRNIDAPITIGNPRSADWLAGTHPRLDENSYRGTVRADYDLSDALQLTYVGAYQHYRQNDQYQSNGADAPGGVVQGGRIESHSHELRLGGNWLSGRLIGLLGASYQAADVEANDFQNFAGNTSGGQVAPFNGGVPLTALRNISTDKSNNRAVFTNLEFHPNDQFAIHAGVRYTKSEIDHSGCSADAGDGVGARVFNNIALRTQQQGGGAAPPPAVAGGCVTPAFRPLPGSQGVFGLTNQSLDQHNVSWRLGLDWTPAPRTLVYATVSKGYKAGNFPTYAATTFESFVPVTQESLLAYELGVKVGALDNRLRVDASVFYYDYTDQQLSIRVRVPVFTSAFNVTRLINIPKSEVKGAELKLSFNPVKALDISLNGAYLDTKVTRGPAPSDVLQIYNPFGTALATVVGESFPGAPKWRLSGTVQYNFDINDRLSAFLAIDGRYQTKSQGLFGSYDAIAKGFITNASGPGFQNIGAAPGSLSTVIEAYGVADIRAGVRSTDGNWRVQAFVRNVTNAYYWTQAKPGSDAITRYPGMPRTYGLTVGYRY